MKFYTEFVALRTFIAKLLVLLVTCQITALADDRIEVLQLRQRTADQVIPLVRPLLRPDEAVSGTGFQLILRARPQTIAEVRKVLERLDADLKNLMILVTHENMSSRSRAAADANIRYHSEYGGAVSARAYQDQRTDGARIAQRIRVIEGNPAALHVGSALLSSDPYGASRTDIGTGVTVIPRLNGQQVNLEIQPYRERLRLGTHPDRWIGRQQNVEVERLSTVVSGKLGEWIFLGGANQSAQSGSRHILSGSRQSTAKNSGVWVKVLLAE